jgi:hypothetical protein
MQRLPILLAALLLHAFPLQAAIITVGTGKQYPTLNAAITNAQANDEIRIDAGVYVNDYSTISVPLTIVGIGGIAVLDANAPIPNGKAILVTRANVTIRNLEFRDATVPDRNGAGIRHELGDLTVENSTFRNNEDGILGNDGAGIDVVVRDSTFIDSGFGDGRSHALYVNNIASLTVEDSDFSGTLVGHDIKSRAATTIVRNNVLDDGVSGTTSYAIDISNCGIAQIIGNEITQGPNTENPSMVAYGPEGCTKATNSLLVEDNSFVNTRPGTTIGVNNFSSVVAVLRNNTFQGLAQPLRGPGIFVGPDPDPDPDPTPVPAPMSLALLGFAAAALALMRQRRGQRA